MFTCCVLSHDVVVNSCTVKYSSMFYIYIKTKFLFIKIVKIRTFKELMVIMIIGISPNAIKYANFEVRDYLNLYSLCRYTEPLQYLETKSAAACVRPVSLPASYLGPANPLFAWLAGYPGPTNPPPSYPGPVNLPASNLGLAANLLASYLGYAVNLIPFTVTCTIITLSQLYMISLLLL